jgi:sulfate permease, SulP family
MSSDRRVGVHEGGSTIGHRWWRLPPVLSWCHGYQRSWLLSDVVAGLLIVTIAIPLSMGMAEVAGVAPVVGLYTCVLPLIGYALLGSSKHLVLGLDASTAAMIAAAVGPLAVANPAKHAQLASAVALGVGLVCLAAGFLRLGAVVDLLSAETLLGYQAGLAVTVIINQFARLARVSTQRTSPWGRGRELMSSIDQFHRPSLLVGIVALVAVVVLRRYWPKFPGALVVVAVAAWAVTTQLRGRGLVVIGPIPSGGPSLAWPTLSRHDFGALFGAIVAIALVASADTVASAKAFALHSDQMIDSNRELAGLGAANVLSGLSGGVAASASAARTAVAETAGAHTPLASVVAALTLLGVLTTMTGPLQRVPLAALAAIVIAAVARLIDLRAFAALWQENRASCAVAIVTMVLVVVVGVLAAIVMALALSTVQRVLEPRAEPRA